MSDSSPGRTRPDDKLRLERIGRKKFIIRRPFGAALQVYKCGYLEAQRRFAVFMVTHALTK